MWDVWGTGSWVYSEGGGVYGCGREVVGGLEQGLPHVCPPQLSPIAAASRAVAAMV